MFGKKYNINTWKELTIELLKNNKRIDDRGFFEYRNIEVDLNPISNAEGSSIVKLGNTIVSAGVKIDVGEPFKDMPNLGILVVNAEITSLSEEGIEPGPPGPEAIELARVIDRALREGNVVDLEKLSIIDGEKVFIIFLDIYVYNNDGNIYDASYIASLLALRNTYLPKLDEDYNIIYGEKTNKKLPLKNDKVYLTTFSKIDRYIVLDPNYIEEEISDVILHVATDGKKIYAYQKRGEGFINEEEIKTITKKALEVNPLKKWKEMKFI